MKRPMINRRQFILSSAALGAVGTLPSFAAARDMSRPNLKFGVISDVHIRNPGDEKIVWDALCWYRDQRVDAVVVAGDVADYGLIWQIDAFMGAWHAAFPDGRCGGKDKVELIYITGNHEYDIWKKLGHIYKGEAKVEPQVFVKNIEREWPRLFGEPYAPTFVKTVKGYSFFCSNFLGFDPAVNLAAIRALFERAAIPSDRPFFLVQHDHPKGTCGYTPGKPNALTDFLSQYRNLVCLSGHCHATLADKRSFWHGAFTSVNTSTLQKVWNSPEAVAAGAPQSEPRAQGLLVRVWPDYVHFEKRDFTEGKRLDPHWEVKL